MIELVPLARQFQSILPEMMDVITETIESGKYVLGPNVKKLESEIATYLQATHAIGVANGTDALVLALDALGIGTGDEVITTPFTFFASAEAISRVGAIPVFADIDPHTYCIDPVRIEEKITSATKAIIPVHLFGQSADMDEIMDIADRYGLKVIEDACQAFGSEYKGRRVGSIGHVACFSFFPTKNLGTVGDGGLIVTSGDDLARKVRLLRQHGSEKKYHHTILGYNSRLDELHAGILRIALTKIDEWNQRRMVLAVRYREALKDLPDLTISPERDDRNHIYHLFCVESTQREQLLQLLKSHDIQSSVYYPCPLHLQEVYAHLHYAPGDFPVSERLSTELFALPMGAFLYEEEQDQVISVLKSTKGEGSS